MGKPKCPIDKNRDKEGKFIKGSIPWTKGKKGKLKNYKNLGEKNGMWKGDKVGRSSLHEWINKRKPKPKFCEMCRIKSPHDLANISGEYKRDVNDFEWLCRKCHMKGDGRLKKLQEFNEDKKISEKEKKERKSEFYTENKERIRKQQKEYYNRKRITCPICNEPMVNEVDTITKKLSKYLWKTKCGHANNLRLSIG